VSNKKVCFGLVLRSSLVALTQSLSQKKRIVTEISACHENVRVLKQLKTGVFLNVNISIRMHSFSLKLWTFNFFWFTYTSSTYEPSELASRICRQQLILIDITPADEMMRKESQVELW
jgi:hypothetical protein